MTNLEISADLHTSAQRRPPFTGLAFAARQIARWAAARRHRRMLQETLRELDRLDAFTLADIGVLRSARRARWVDMGHNLPPRLVVELVDVPPPGLHALNLWGKDLQP